MPNNVAVITALRVDVMLNVTGGPAGRWRFIAFTVCVSNVLSMFRAVRLILP